VSGLGVDYRNTSIENPNFFGPGIPLVAGEYTQLQVLKFSPSVAFQPNEKLSLGLGVHINYSNLDLRNGTSFNYGLGVQLGALYKLTDMVSIGATYVSPQEVNHENVVDFNHDGIADNLKLESPQQVGIGISIEPVKDVFLIEVDGKWLNWANAKGYKDFDWKDQWVLAIGAQYKPTKQLALRAGYNYGNNPVREHNNFNGNVPISVQGVTIPAAYYYETFRIIGFPAIAKQHLSFGIGYEISKRFAINAGYTHAFKETLKENGIFGPAPVSLQSHLSEDSLEFGFTWRF
jgi:long-chain fatty acid transport protein